MTSDKNNQTDSTQLSEELQQLAQEAQSHPTKSKKWRQSLNQLISLLQKSGKLYCSRKYNYPPDVYEEAMQETLIEISRKIENYDPAKGSFIAWANGILKYKFMDGIKRHKKTRQVVSLDAISANSDKSRLESIPQPIKATEPSEKIREIVEKDPENLFKNKHVKGRPEVNFQAIALRRLDKKSWQQISSKFGVKVPTLSVFYQRSCQHFQAKFDEYLEAAFGDSIL